VTWKDDLRRVDFAGKKLIGASFRGVSFFVDSAQRSGGRRTVKHEFPFRDKSFTEDLGKKAADYPIDGYVIGDDYLDQKNALIDALEGQEGPGELVHPYYGALSAICSGFTVRESRTEGGFAQFAIQFDETPAQAPQPSAVVDASDQVSDAADAANTASSTELVSVYDTTGLPSFALASAQTAIENAIATMKNELGPVITATQEAAQLTSQATLITAEAASLVRTPALILGRFHDVLAALVTTVLAAPGAVLDALTAAYAGDLGPLTSATTSTRQRELDNQVALQNALRRFFAIEAARLAPIVPYVSLDEALAARDSITAMLDEQTGLAGDDAYPSLVDLRAQVLQAVPGGDSFARVVTVTRNVAVPSLLLTYQLYGSVDLEADVIARNNVAHPGFVAGDLKVLSDG
jgi:prophage DNA circulation protein